jgi:pentatricopeptide repeat protein
MVEYCRIVPRMEHYGCIVDLLGRAGKLQEAVRFIESMPLKPGVVIWVTLLSSCITHGDAELSEYVSTKIVEMEPFNSSYQVLVSNCSALEGRWDSVMDARRTMRDCGVEKTPGSSLIQVGNEVHEFLAKDTRHKKRKEVYKTLDGLIALIRHTDHTPLDKLLQPLE